MEQIVRVRKTFDDGTAQVLHIRESACSGDCHKCSGCGAAKEGIELMAKNPIGAKTGDFVTIEAATGPVLRGAAVLYMMPLLLFFLGYALGAVVWSKGGLAGCLGFVLGIALVIVYDRRVAAKNETAYTITGFAGKTLESMKKGDNDLD